MSNQEEGVSFGFSPQGRLGEQDEERPVRAAADREAPRPVPHEMSPSSKVNLAWLLIGVLVGAGGTMVGSSFWLQGSYVNPSIAMDAEATDAKALRSETRADMSTAAGVRSVDVGDRAASLRGGGAEKTAGSTAKAGLATRKPDTNEKARLARQTSVRARDASAPGTVDRANPADTGEALLVAANVTNRSPAKEVRPTTPSAVAGSLSSTRDEVADRAGRTTAALTLDPAAGKPAASVAGTGASGASGGSPGVAQTRASEATKVAGSVNVPKPATKTTDAPRSSTRVYRVQLAAVDNERAAQTYWQEAQTRLPALFDDIEPLFDQREVDKRVFFRIWIGAFDKHAEADAYCGRLKKEGQDCFVTRG